MDGTNPDKSNVDGTNKLDEARIKGLEEDLRKDNQLQQAVTLLSGWEVMKRTFDNLNLNNADPISRINLQ